MARGLRCQEGLVKQLDPWVVVVDGEIVERHPNRTSARAGAAAIRQSTRDQGKRQIQVWRLSVWESAQDEANFHAPRLTP